MRKSLVLLKNGKPGSTPLLPLPKKASKILVAGTHADNLGYQCGGWTINWQGFDGNNSTRGMLYFIYLSLETTPANKILAAINLLIFLSMTRDNNPRCHRIHC